MKITVAVANTGRGTEKATRVKRREMRNEMIDISTKAHHRNEIKIPKFFHPFPFI